MINDDLTEHISETVFKHLDPHDRSHMDHDYNFDFTEDTYVELWQQYKSLVKRVETVCNELKYYKNSWLLHKNTKDREAFLNILKQPNK